MPCGTCPLLMEKFAYKNSRLKKTSYKDFIVFFNLKNNLRSEWCEKESFEWLRKRP